MERIFFGTGPVVGNKRAVQFVRLGPQSGQWQDLNGDHVAYAPVEDVQYFSTIAEQTFQQRGHTA